MYWRDTRPQTEQVIQLLGGVHSQVLLENLRNCLCLLVVVVDDEAALEVPNKGHHQQHGSYHPQHPESSKTRLPFTLIQLGAIFLKKDSKHHLANIEENCLKHTGAVYFTYLFCYYGIILLFEYMMITILLLIWSPRHDTVKKVAITMRTTDTKIPNHE